MSVPLITIVLPTYNGSRYIRKSIESCLEQTAKDFELIVVNDYSTDNTVDIINEYCLRDPRVRLINNEFNKKLPLSLNAGFKKDRENILHGRRMIITMLLRHWIKWYVFLKTILQLI